MEQKRRAQAEGHGWTLQDPMVAAIPVDTDLLEMFGQAAFPVSGEHDYLFFWGKPYVLDPELGGEALDAVDPKAPLDTSIITRRIIAKKGALRRYHKNEIPSVGDLYIQKHYNRLLETQAGKSPFRRQPKNGWVKLNKNIYEDPAARAYFIRNLKSKEFSIEIPKIDISVEKRDDEVIKLALTPPVTLRNCVPNLDNPHFRPIYDSARKRLSESSQDDEAQRKSLAPPPMTTFIDETPVQRAIRLAKERYKEKQQLDALRKEGKSKKNLNTLHPQTEPTLVKTVNVSVPFQKMSGMPLAECSTVKLSSVVERHKKKNKLPSAKKAKSIRQDLPTVPKNKTSESAYRLEEENQKKKDLASVELPPLKQQHGIISPLADSQSSCSSNLSAAMGSPNGDLASNPMSPCEEVQQTAVEMEDEKTLETAVQETPIERALRLAKEKSKKRLDKTKAGEPPCQSEPPPNKKSRLESQDSNPTASVPATLDPIPTTSASMKWIPSTNPLNLSDDDGDEEEDADILKLYVEEDEDLLI